MNCPDKIAYDISTLISRVSGVEVQIAEALVLAASENWPFLMN